MKCIYSYVTQIGKISIIDDNDTITNLFFENDTIPDNIIIKESQLIQEAHRQLTLYLSGDLKHFSLALKPKGTDFMMKVWKELLNIPYGTTKSYKDIAIAIGDDKASRAVGMANNRNPLPIFIPCHRVIGSNGKLVGYGSGLDIKVKLLKIEGENNTSKYNNAGNGGIL